jgi:hypothetical protein
MIAIARISRPPRPLPSEQGLLPGRPPSEYDMKRSLLSLALVCGAFFAFANAPASAAPQ